MGIGVRYDDGSGSMRPLADYKKPLASYRGMASPWGSNGHSLFGTPSTKSMNGPALRRKSIFERMQERRDAAKKDGAAKDAKLDEIDPRKNGKVIGEASAPHPADADKNSRGANDHSPWGRACMTGIHFEREAPTGRIIVWGYLRTDRFTGEGRCFETTGEEKVPVFSFFDAQSDDKGCYRMVVDEDGQVSFENRYVQIAGKLYDGPSQTYSEDSLKGKFLAIDATVSSSSGDTSFQFQTYASLVALQTAQKDPDHLIIPLYKFDSDANVECDFRTVPYEWQMNYN